MDSILYNIHKTYDDNFKQGPIELNKLKKPLFKKAKTRYNFLGFPIDIPFGIPAGPLLNSKFIKAAFDFGFAVSTYKTVRSDFFPCHPYPNVVYVKTPDKLIPSKTQRLITTTSPKVKNKFSITNSFGVPSKTPSLWQKDVQKAKSYEKNGKLLILSFMGTVEKEQTQKQFIEDFAIAAKLAKKTGARVVEVNLSCPNIGNEGLVCYNLSVTEKVCKAIRNAIGNTPLILKVGYYKNEKDIEEIARITNKYANAIAAINTLQVEIVDKDGKQALPGKNRIKSGVCGSAIKWAGIEMVEKLKKIREENKYKYEIVGIGGVMTPKDFLDYRKAGADLVQSATGAMWNPYLAYEIRKEQK